MAERGVTPLRLFGKPTATLSFQPASGRAGGCHEEGPSQETQKSGAVLGGKRCSEKGPSEGEVVLGG